MMTKCIHDSKVHPRARRGWFQVMLIGGALIGGATTAWAQEPPPGGTVLDQLEQDAATRYAEGDNVGAIALYRQLADRAVTDENRVSALMNVAWLEHLEGRDNAAINALTEALALDPDHPFRPELYTDAFGVLFDQGQERASRKRAIDIADQVQRALDARARGDYERAGTLLEQASALQPTSPEILLNLALIRLDLNQEDEALAGFERVLALGSRPDVDLQDSHRAYALAKIGYLYNRRQRHDEAARHLEQAVALAPDNSTAWTNLGVAHKQLGDAGAAAQAFQRAVDLDPDDADAASNLALAYLDLGDAAGAAGLLDRANERWPSNAALQLQRGRALSEQGDQAAALSAFERVVRLDADNQLGHAAPAAAFAAKLYHQQKNPDRTLEMATAATRWRPDLVDGWILQGLALRTLGQASPALERFQEALRQDPTRADVLLQVGSLQHQLRDFDAAETAFRRALEIDPSSSAARENLAAVRTRQPLAVPGAGSTAGPAAQSGAGAATRATQRPTLGLGYADYDYTDLGLDGVAVATVERHSPAGRAGIQPNDLILKVDGRSMASASDLERYLFTETRAIQFTVDLLRDNRPVRVIVRLE